MSNSNATSSAQFLSVLSEEKLVQLIRHKTGMALQDHQLSTLRDTVKQTCQRFGHRTADELLVQLQEDANLVTAEMEFLIGGITVGESYFFRDQSQMDFLRHSWLPGILRKKRARQDKSLRIWSAGCSSGQELYSIAMLLNDILPDLADWQLHLLGTDINTSMLSTAIKGNYTKWSLRSTPDDVRKKHFSRRDSEFIIRPELREMASFSYLNLVNDNYPSILTDTNALDLILCRNVFIYFDQNTIASVMRKFTGCLTTDGILMLGASDHIHQVSEGLTLGRRNDILYYQHSGASTRASAASLLSPSAPPDTRSPTSSVAQRPAQTKTSDRKSERRMPAVQNTEASAITQSWEDILGLMRTERWRDVITTADAALQRYGEHADFLQCQAKALANLGELAPALAVCQRVLRLDATDKHTYLIQALVQAELNQQNEAETSLRKTIFLDRQMVEAHYHLGLLLLRQGQQKKGIKCLHNALKLTQSTDSDRRIHNSQGMTFGRFAKILQSEIDIYENLQIRRIAGDEKYR